MQIRIHFRIQGFDDQTFLKIYSWKKTFIFWIQNTYYISNIHKGRTSYRRSLQPSKRTSSPSKHENSLLFSIFVCLFSPPGSGFAFWMRIRMRVKQLKLTQIHADPDADPQPWSSHSTFFKTSTFLIIAYLDKCVKLLDPDNVWFWQDQWLATVSRMF